jgi:hypothetical protein
MRLGDERSRRGAKLRRNEGHRKSYYCCMLLNFGYEPRSASAPSSFALLSQPSPAGQRPFPSLLERETRASAPASTSSRRARCWTP